VSKKKRPQHGASWGHLSSEAGADLASDSRTLSCPCDIGSNKYITDFLHVACFVTATGGLLCPDSKQRLQALFGLGALWRLRVSSFPIVSVRITASISRLSIDRLPTLVR
jgi:hypothetical protein